jgi:hypothetical protein
VKILVVDDQFTPTTDVNTCQMNNEQNEKCGLCNSTQTTFNDFYRVQHCLACGALKTETGWRQVPPTERVVKYIPANRPITEAFAENWWNSRTPEERYRDMAYDCGWSAATINHEGGPFTGDWKSQPPDVRESILLGMRQGYYIKGLRDTDSGLQPVIETR